MDLIEVTETIAHLAHLELGAVRQGHEREVSFGERDVETSIPRVLARLDPDLGACVRVDLTEEGDLDLPREEQVLEAGEAAALVLLHVVLGQVAHEVACDAHVEEELARAAPLVEGEGLTRPYEIEGGRLAAGWPLRDLGGQGRCGGRGLGHFGRRGGGAGRPDGGLRARLDALEALDHRVQRFLVLLLHDLELLAHLLHLTPERFRVLRTGRRGNGKQRQHDGGCDECTHGVLPMAKLVNRRARMSAGRLPEMQGDGTRREGEREIR